MLVFNFINIKIILIILKIVLISRYIIYKVNLIYLLKKN